MTTVTDPLSRTAGREASPARLVTLFGADGRAASLAEHRERYGRLPVIGTGRERQQLIDVVAQAGLRGRGGAGFPTARKLATVGKGRNPTVVVNGCEGEPASRKDLALQTLAPHLVLDGAVLAAMAVGARRVVLCVHRASPSGAALMRAIAERGDQDPVSWQVAQVPRRYVSSEESSLVHFLNSGDARPLAVPPRPFERGVDGRPTLIDNVETLAHLAMIVRYGAAWFRELGTAGDPGTSLVTIGGAVARPGVYEVILGSSLGTLLDLAGGPAQPVQAVLVGGYFGTWEPAARLADLPVGHDPVGPNGTTIGAGAIMALPAADCGLLETSRVLDYLAHESAGQCGPCRFGLPAVAEQLRTLAAGRLHPAHHRKLLERLSVIKGRGACRHPDGAIRLAESALRTFADDARNHLSGRPCAGVRHPAVLPLPRFADVDRGWE